MKNKIFKIFAGLFFIVPCVSWAGSLLVEYRGQVTDSEANPISDVSIICVDANYGCTTSAQGTFNCPLECNKVRISHIGYKTKDFSLDGNVNNIIVLEKEDVSLSSVTVVEENGAKNIKPKPATLLKAPESSTGPKDMERTTSVAESLCVGQDGKWVKLDSGEYTCDCKGSLIWNKNIQKCEDADISAAQDACWKIKRQATWNDEKNECICNDAPKKEFQYDSQTKTGKCVTVKQEKKETPKEEPKDNRTDEEKNAALSEKQAAYDAAYEKQDSDANRALTGITTAAMGIGAMELVQGMYEKGADKDADKDMTAYMATFRCTYGDGKFVLGGVEEIELPGGNDEAIMNYRNEYLALAANLKERKESLNMKPGIESQEIFDKANAGLYDDENVGITGGIYSSLYRAKMGNETDATNITTEQETTANRLKYGAIAVGAGAAVGVVGNSLINGKLGELIKDAVNGTDTKANKAVINKLKSGLSSAGLKNVGDLDFSNLDLTKLAGDIDKIDFTSMAEGVSGQDATKVLNTSNSGSFISSFGKILGDKNSGLFN